MSFDYESVEGNYQHTAHMHPRSVRHFWHDAKLKLLTSQVEIAGGGHVVDVGCGSGNASIAIARTGCTVTGLDLSSQAIAFCTQRAAQEGINAKFLKITGKKLPLRDASADIVISSEVIEHLSDPAEHLRELHRILRPNGTLILTTPNYRSAWPLLEFISDTLRLTPKMRGEQHIFFVTPKKLHTLLHSTGFTPKVISSYYGISPFINPFSPSLARRLFSRELTPPRTARMILYTVARKIARKNAREAAA